MSGSLDVLVVTALPDEFGAAKTVAAARPDGTGVDRWLARSAGSVPYEWGAYRTADGRRLSVALARPTHTGGRSTSPLVTGLVDALRPTCVAMCGGCAGNPGVTVPGDVVVAEPVYEWDEGRQSTSGLEGDHRQYRLDPRWVRAAQDFDPSRLATYGRGGDDEALLWLLERLHLGQPANTHPARSRYFPPGTWGERLNRWQDGGWITRDPTGAPHPTGAGTARLRRHLYDAVDGVLQLPYRVQVAPMASGSAVVDDGRIWRRLERMGMRTIAAVDREGATIATVAHDRRVPYWLVVKGVADHADGTDDDRCRAFAARASAEVLFALLGQLVAPTDRDGPAASAPRETGAIQQYNPGGITIANTGTTGDITVFRDR